MEERMNTPDVSVPDASDPVSRFASRWDSLPDEIKTALIELRQYEEEGAANLSVISEPARGFFRQMGGTENVMIQRFVAKEAEGRDDGLTVYEGCVMDSLVVAVEAFAALDNHHPTEVNDFINAIHRCQDILGVRVARRHYPKGWPTYAESNDPADPESDYITPTGTQQAITLHASGEFCPTDPDNRYGCRCAAGAVDE
jgi:hypothetical protein